MAKETIRKIDSIGRIVIPAKWRKEKRFKAWQAVEITIEYGKICVRKYEKKDASTVPYIGMVRCLDEVNRVCIPKEYIEVCGFKDDKVQMNLLDEKIEISQE